MYFKSLELIGFKSFADKTKLNFEPGVTAIIGPNGCGKSNIADGIRWVLGEQSTKSLRASKMEDVIFNGTDTKEPISFAEVSLTLSNEKRLLPIDYDEVTISRRIFRSGDNEYLLNKTPVRLKDISELLMGTGIGTESYSIIEQGKMDLILSSRPEDRRYVFEEASGITKYKAKKKEALRKLEQTEQNLLRINDIIQEVKRQIGSIERQARKAEKYKIDFDKLKDIELKLSYLEFRDLRTQEKTYSVENSDMREREKVLAEEIDAISGKIGDYRQELEEVVQKISEMKGRHSAMSGSFDMNAHRIEIDRERVEETCQLKKGLEDEIASIESKISLANELVRTLQIQLEKAAAESAARQKVIGEKERRLEDIAKEISLREEKIKLCKVTTIDHLAKETKIKNELIKLGADIQNRKARQRRLEIEKDTIAKELAAIGETLKSVVKEFEISQERISKIRAGAEEKKESEGALSAELRAIEDELNIKNSDQAAAKSKIEFLEDIIKKHEGFKSGVKIILEKLDTAQDAAFRGMIAVLADIIKVEPGYEDAVHTFLGDDAQLVITERDEDISRAVSYLKEHNCGKASFISLEILKTLECTAQGNAPRDGLVPLARFVRAEGRYTKLMDYLFGNVYIADSLDSDLTAWALANKTVIATRAGLVFEDGRFTGGSASEEAGALLIGRRARLDAIRSELKEIEDHILSRKGSREEKAAALNTLRDEIRIAEANFHSEEITLANIKSKKDSQEADAKKITDEHALVELELNEVGQTLDELTGKGEELNKELNDIESRKNENQQVIEESQSVITTNSDLKEKMIIELATLKTEAQGSIRTEEAVRAQAGKEEASLNELVGALKSKKNLFEDTQGKIAMLEDEIKHLAFENESIMKEIKALKAELTGIEKARSDVMDKLSIDEIQLKAKEKDAESLRDQIRDLDVKIAEISYKKTNLKERIFQSYKEDLEAMHMETEESVDREALHSQVSELKERLDKLGPVNLVAIDEHKELEERHAFLVRQQEDLVNAKESLLKAIQKINKTTKDLFIETFQKIQVEFKNFFRLLFGGGQAELVLIDEQDILESGIEIIVRPPGKKLQNISLLSGGEKALTATALLFSIFKVKPSPFCVLDEIDAPLDESNVARFSNVLKDFLKMSQFIIITHNKRTIELADVMYGITMQERGVSKIVSVKFMEDTKKEVLEPSAPA